KQKQKFKLIIIGCLPQLEKENLLIQYPQIDGIFGISDYPKITKFLKNIQQKNNLKSSVSRKIIEISSQESFLPSCRIPRVLSTPKSYAYLKIADGCDNKCAYCLIPTIRGNYRERPIEDIVKEAENIVNCGVKELILISHDTTLYGIKIYKKQMLHRLIKELSKIKNLLWIRILYTHPANFYDELVSEIKENKKFCRYLDIPIQHTSDKILSLMERKITRKQIFNLIDKLKKQIPDITLRTTIIVGFPKEKDDDFKILLNDIKNLEFDWLGCFMYSEQKNTKAEKLSPKVDNNTKKQRLDEIIRIQQKITYQKNKSRVGKIYKILVDKENFGHTEFQCPEVDGKTYFLNPAKNLVEEIRIKNVNNIYDLEGEIL
ncbi:MAG: MiaB/RimO family radical SAM methylthiotransferase, partial [Endomicrobiia bacterium]